MHVPIASVDGGGRFMRGASGRWATERMLAAANAGRPLRLSELRSCDTLRKDEWKAFDDALVQEGRKRLRAAQLLYGRGLTINLSNALGKTLQEYEKMTDMQAAVISLDGLARSDNDRVEFSLGAVPLPIIHKDFDISIRTLEASRSRGESLDVIQGAQAGRVCSEQLENILLNGGPTFGGNPIYGLRTEPSRNTGAHGTNGLWSSYPTKTPANMIADVITMKSALQGDFFYGPYALLLPGNYDTVVDNDYDTGAGQNNITIRERILKIDGIEVIEVCDQLPNSEMVMFQLTSDVASIVDGEDLQTVQWDLGGGLAVAMKAMMIQVPLVRSTAGGRSGVYHMSGT